MTDRAPVTALDTGQGPGRRWVPISRIGTSSSPADDGVGLPVDVPPHEALAVRIWPFSAAWMTAEPQLSLTLNR